MKVLEAELTRRSIVELARTDICVYAEYVFDMHLSWFHRELLQDMVAHKLTSRDCPVEHGKTTLVSIVLPSWEIGVNPSAMLAIIGNAPRRPRECLATIKNTILYNPKYKEVFPHIKLMRATRDEIVVDREVTSDAGPSILAIGIGGSIIGSRLTGIVLDDIQDWENTYSDNQKRRLKGILESTILNRRAQSGWIHDIGTPWSWDDARTWLRTLKGFDYKVYDAMDNLWPDEWVHPKTGTVWGWPPERLEEYRERLSRHEWMRQYRCKPMSALTQIFSPDDIEACLVKGLGRMGRDAEKFPVTVTGVDLATDRKSFADKTVLFTMAPHDGKKELLDIQQGHWELPEILRRMLMVVRRYPNNFFRVETNAGFAFLAQGAKNPEIMRALGASEEDLQRLRIRPHVTGKKKMDPETGIRSMCIDFEQQRWLIPCDQSGKCERIVDEWINHLINFDPVSHTSDLIMATWLASEESRRFFSGGSTWESMGMR